MKEKEKKRREEKELKRGWKRQTGRKSVARNAIKKKKDGNDKGIEGKAIEHNLTEAEENVEMNWKGKFYKETFRKTRRKKKNKRRDLCRKYRCWQE